MGDERVSSLMSIINSSPQRSQGQRSVDKVIIFQSCLLFVDPPRGNGFLFRKSELHIFKRAIKRYTD